MIAGGAVPQVGPLSFSEEAGPPGSYTQSASGVLLVIHRSLSGECLPFTCLEEKKLNLGFYRSPNGQHVASITDERVNQANTRAAAILIDNPVGSGIFYYVIVAARVDGRASYSAPLFLGDRINIEAVSVSGETVLDCDLSIVVN